ncbi:apolipoprotein N-acyltransferase [Streptomyces malaysiensis subsp. malaysiensis]|uniref:Nitrilase n=1 Tax=Streptomyces malaysiensis TaxID=92644 RepID=A0ABX6W020_STRMQ|nr:MULTISPECIES: nitrilase-related carbon-nitrogen hydrolase [Streptomyces]QPI54248.1 nitrilase [Streptomyces solisilvae]UHH15641.1 nitrilase [Streptomyces sp. HNM0561]
MSESPGPLVPAGARYPWLCLWGGAAASLLSVGGRFDVPLAAWVAPLLLIRFLRHTRPLVGLLAVFAVTVVSAAVWMAELAVPITWLTLLGDVAFGIAYGLPYVVDRLLAPRTGTLGRVLLFPAAAMSVEFLLGTFGPFGTAYGMRAASQHSSTALLQITALGGPYVIAFLIGAAATIGNLVRERGAHRTALRWAALYAAAVALIVVGGQVRMVFTGTGGDTVKVAGINPSRAAIDAETAVHGASRLDVTDPRRVDRADVRRAAQPLLDDLFRQTARAAAAGARIVVWSENAARVADEDHGAYLRQASEAAAAHNIYLLVADLTYLPDAPHGRDETHLFGPDGTKLWDYEKARPIPGLEIYTPGDGRVPVVDTPYGRLANLICYDADFPADTHIDADIVLVPGGDWPEMGRTHTAMAGLRAIENGYALVRQDFNGQSGAYDATGRPLSTKDTTTDSGIWYADVPTHGSPTPYSRTGDIVAWGVLAGTLAAATAIATRSRRRPAPPSPAASAARASGVGPGR